MLNKLRNFLRGQLEPIERPLSVFVAFLVLLSILIVPQVVMAFWGTNPRDFSGGDILIFLFLSMLFFPIGLGTALGIPGEWIESFGFIVYTTTIIGGTILRTRKVFITIIILMIVLVLINLKGCSQMAYSPLYPTGNY
jgi:hypothetical protein